MQVGSHREYQNACRHKAKSSSLKNWQHLCSCAVLNLHILGLLLWPAYGTPVQYPRCLINILIRHTCEVDYLCKGEVLRNRFKRNDFKESNKRLFVCLFKWTNKNVTFIFLFLSKWACFITGLTSISILYVVKFTLNEPQTLSAFHMTLKYVRNLLSY